MYYRAGGIDGAISIFSETHPTAPSGDRTIYSPANTEIIFTKQMKIIERALSLLAKVC
jgi:hypothetical protein